MPVIIYSGQNDLDVPGSGSATMVETIKWELIEDYRKQKKQVWRINDKVVGTVKTYNNLTRANIYKSGHMCPGDQPEATLNMVRKWMNRVQDWTK